MMDKFVKKPNSSLVVNFVLSMAKHFLFATKSQRH